MFQKISDKDMPFGNFYRMSMADWIAGLKCLLLKRKEIAFYEGCCAAGKLRKG